MERLPPQIRRGDVFSLPVCGTLPPTWSRSVNSRAQLETHSSTQIGRYKTEECYAKSRVVAHSHIVNTALHAHHMANPVLLPQTECSQHRTLDRVLKYLGSRPCSMRLADVPNEIEDPHHQSQARIAYGEQHCMLDSAPSRLLVSIILVVAMPILLVWQGVWSDHCCTRWMGGTSPKVSAAICDSAS